MANSVPTPPHDDGSLQDIRALLDEIRRQNAILKRYVYILSVGVALLLLIETNLITTIINYAVIVVIVIAVMLSAPMWSPFIVSLTDRMSWFPKKKKDRRDSAADPV